MSSTVIIEKLNTDKWVYAQFIMCEWCEYMAFNNEIHTIHRRHTQSVALKIIIYRRHKIMFMVCIDWYNTQMCVCYSIANCAHAHEFSLCQMVWHRRFVPTITMKDLSFICLEHETDWQSNDSTWKEVNNIAYILVEIERQTRSWEREKMPKQTSTVSNHLQAIPPCSTKWINFIQ